MVYVQMRYLGQGLVWVAGEPDIYGQPTFNAPRPMKHRWEDRTGLFINNQGRQEGFKHRVYMDTPVKPGDRLAKRSTDGFDNSIEIKDVREILSVNGKKREIRALL
jgi:hypothetical protein